MYTMILTTYLFSEYFRQSSSATSVVVPGFQTEQLCLDALANSRSSAPVDTGKKYKLVVVISGKCLKTN